MDQAARNAERWSDEAERLLHDAPFSLVGKVDFLAGLLAQIDSGTRLRHTLDPDHDPASESVRHGIMRRLTQLRLLLERLLDRSALNPSSRQAIETSIKNGLSQAKVLLRDLAANPRYDTLDRALSMEALRGDLDWISGIVARLDREPAPSPTASLDVEIDRLRYELKKEQAEHGPDPGLADLLRESDRSRAVLLERRIRRELGRSTDGVPAEELLANRLKLSRLQARIATIEAVGDPRTADQSPRLESDPDHWVRAIEDRRTLLSDLAELQLLAMPLTQARVPCVRAAQFAQVEISEIIAFVEDTPLRRAVTRLDLASDDLGRLALTLRRRANVLEETQPREPFATDHERERARRDADRQAAAREHLGRQAGKLSRLRRRVRGEWQEKLLSFRLDKLLGTRLHRAMETAVLWLIALLVALIVDETILDHMGWLTPRAFRWLAWADLAICSLLIAEFSLRLSLAPRKGLYFLRHFVIDFLASLPYGFFLYLLAPLSEKPGATWAVETLWLLQLLRVGRLLESVARYLQVAVPIVRVTRLAVFLLRLSDRLVRKHAGLLNRNIILFEPLFDEQPESSNRHHLASLRSELEDAAAQNLAELTHAEKSRLLERLLATVDLRIETLPVEAFDGDGQKSEAPEAREIPVEALVDRLIQLSPEQLIDRMGVVFVTSADRYLRLLDAPLIRRLPVVRNVVAYRQKSPAEAVTLAANYLGHSIQQMLDAVYFLADLQGTLSPAVFLDRLGATIVTATRNPAKRLLWIGSLFLFLFVIVNLLPFFRPFRAFVDEVQKLLGTPVIVLGVICLGFWLLGSWFRKIANQSADYSERVVEAQFAAQTKTLKSHHRDKDARFLARRVIDPELLLRSSDDHYPELHIPPGLSLSDAEEGAILFENRELAFLRNIRLLYQDYLDGSPFHRSDTKASVQLLGNLALANLRRSHLGHLLREGRALDRLDLSRAGRLFGGPYLWFHYITRMIVQETAILLIDYNRNAIPLDRLACSPPESRRAFQNWLGRRLKIDPNDVWLPDPLTAQTNDRAGGVQGSAASSRPEAGAFLETVEFTAIDFLSGDPQRDEAIATRFGRQVADLVHRDRQQNVRRAFRSFPLHELPLAQRTINPYVFYEAHLSRGRIVFLPLMIMAAAFKTLGFALRTVYRIVREILHPKVDETAEVPADTYWAALRKIHRMRKPVFMGSLWLRARFDVEYLGLRLPTAPVGIASQSLIDHDLDFISASRQDRTIAEQIRRGHQRRLEWIGRWLVELGWTFDALPAYLAAEIPYLANRAGEALRALVTACVLDHDDISTLCFSIDGVRRVMAHAADPATDLKTLPAGLPDPVVNTRRLWHPVAKLKTPASGLFALPCFPEYDEAARKRILWCLHYHRRAVRGWVKVVLGQGGNDPWATVRARMREVLLRTDLWSDQMLVLRAVQSLTMLDVQHTCDLVWSLGGYAYPSSSRMPPAPATESRKPADPAMSAMHEIPDPTLDGDSEGDVNGGLWPSADPVGNPHQSGSDPGTS